MSRPRRTRVYNANFDMGERLYKDAIDRLDRKYSGRSESSPARAPSLPQEIQDRMDSLRIRDDDLPSARSRAAKAIADENIFDYRGIVTKRDGIKLQPLLDGDDEFDSEISNTLKRMRDSRKKFVEDIDMEGTVSSMTTKRNTGFAEKILDSVGINEITSRKIQEGENSITNKRRSFNFEDEFKDTPVLSKWTALRDEETSAAALRAKQSRDRLRDLEDEMEAINERQAARERRVKELRALVADTAEESTSVSQRSSLKSSKMSARSEKKIVSF